MINPNECRLGNLVRYEGKEYVLTGIARDYPFIGTIEFGVCVVEWKDLEPIEFDKKYENKVLSDIWFYDDWNGKYVHQLQNLYFALTGNELTLTESV